MQEEIELKQIKNRENCLSLNEFITGLENSIYLRPSKANRKKPYKKIYMSLEETEKIVKLLQRELKRGRSPKEAFEAFKNAGIITEKGNLRFPYKGIYIPVKK